MSGCERAHLLPVDLLQLGHVLLRVVAATRLGAQVHQVAQALGVVGERGVHLLVLGQRLEWQWQQ